MTDQAEISRLKSVLAGVKTIAGTCRKKASPQTMRGAKPTEVAIPIEEWDRLMREIDKAAVNA